MRCAQTVTVALLAVVLAASGCGTATDGAGPTSAEPSAAGPSASSTDFAATLRDGVTTDGMMAHLKALQDIADAHGGNRALGTEGYQASVDYIANALRAKGFDVQVPEFELQVPFADTPKVRVGGADVKAAPLQYTVGTPAEGVRGPLVAARVDESPGCTAADYDGLPVERAVVLVDRGTCPFAEKEAAAAERGAIALIVADNVDDEQSGATLGSGTDVTIPVVSVSKTVGAGLRAKPGDTSISLTAGVRTDKSRSVIAQTKTGSTQDVVVVGGHLDSVPAGPGINDNGSGAAATLEIALQMGSTPPVRNAVRFGFWGGEEVGLVGSTDYVRSLDEAALKDIALYLNIDMIASPNPGFFTYDGDQSAPREPGESPPRVPEGSAGIERNLAAYLDTAGRSARDAPLAGNSDYAGFTRAGIPVGGVFTGATEKMTDDEAALWGGTANEPFDPNYHQKTDTLDRLDPEALGVNGKVIAYAVGVYAQDLNGRNGVPLREDRTRHRIVAP